MGTLALGLFGAIFGAALLALLAVTAVLAVLPSGPAGLLPGPGSARGLPPALPGPGLVSLYRSAATTCPGLSWSVLAAIGTVESANGTSRAPGVHSGANQAGAEGPMQFEPPTFAAYALPVPAGGANPPSPYDLPDAVYAASRDLCAHGGRGGADLAGAVFAYNHDASYVEQVLGLAAGYASAPPAGSTVPTRAPAGTTPEAAVAVTFALAQLGTPYRWGGEGSGGFDCSGLVQAAYRTAGIELPRVAQDQFDAGPALSPAAALEPGDLVFFGTGPAAVDHVGLVVGPNQMVDAPHPGAAVRTEWFPDVLGAYWGDEAYLGATRPALGANPSTALSRP